MRNTVPSSKDFFRGGSLRPLIAFKVHYIIAFSFNNILIIVLILVLCLKTLKSYYILSPSVQVILV